jgi:hypothetical protein
MPEAMAVTDDVAAERTAREFEPEYIEWQGGPHMTSGVFIAPAERTERRAAPTHDFYEQHFEIQLQVADMTQAADTVNRLSGNILHAENFNFDNGGSGNFRLRVALHDYEPVQYTLRGLGDVTYETSTVVHRAEEAADLQARLTAKDEESRRLVGLLEQSHTMDVLVAVERRLGTVENERDGLRGRLRQINSVCTEPYISVFLYENPPEPAILAAEPFSERLNQRFVRSLNTFIRFMENTAVWVSGAFVPLALVTAAAGLVWAIAKRRKGRE